MINLFQKGNCQGIVTTFSTEESGRSCSQNNDKYKTVLKAMALVIQAQVGNNPCKINPCSPLPYYLINSLSTS